MAQANCVPSPIRAPITGASPKTSTKHIRSAHDELVVGLAGHPPRPIPLNPNAVDLEERTAHLKDLLTAVLAYLRAILDDTAQNVPGGLDLRQIDALLCDLICEMSGTIQHAADALPGRYA